MLCVFKRLCQIYQFSQERSVPSKIDCKEYYTFSVKNFHMAELKGRGRRDASPLLRGEESVCDVCMCLCI